MVQMFPAIFIPETVKSLMEDIFFKSLWFEISVLHWECLWGPSYFKVYFI